MGLFGWSRRRDARASAEWDQFVASADRQGWQLLEVLHVYQVARRGTKAVVQPYRGSWQRDAWFWWARVAPGSVVAVASSIGYGPHTHRDNVIYVGTREGGSGIRAALAGKTLKYAKRHRKRTIQAHA